MATTIISNNVSFGSMTNSTMSRLIGLNSTLPRLQEAITTATAAYEGIPGTQFETNGGNMNPSSPDNLFGVKADPAKPGAKGQDYSYAMLQLFSEWQKFWTAASPFIDQLDNGTGMV